MNDISIEIKYLLFYGSDFYPFGGWDDFQGFFDTKEDAIKYLKENCTPDFAWAHIVHDGKIINKFYGKEIITLKQYEWIEAND